MTKRDKSRRCKKANKHSWFRKICKIRARFARRCSWTTRDFSGTRIPSRRRKRLRRKRRPGDFRWKKGGRKKSGCWRTQVARISWSRKRFRSKSRNMPSSRATCPNFSLTDSSIIFHFSLFITYRLHTFHFLSLLMFSVSIISFLGIN